MGNSGRARPRLRISDIAVRFVAEGMEGVGRLIDVSRSGVNVRASEPPRPGAIIALQFESASGKLVDVRGEVRWSRDEGDEAQAQAFGVRIHEPPREFRDFVNWVLARGEKPDAGADPELL